VSALELLLFGTAVQLSAGIVVVINVVLSRLDQAEAHRIGGQ
jgi:hypothetical protein